MAIHRPPSHLVGPDPDSDATAGAGGGLLPPAERFQRRLLRLAADVHDGPMQDLTAIGYGIHDLRRQLEGALSGDRSRAVEATLDELLAECGRVESSLRSLISSLEGGLGGRVSLVEAIGDEVETFRRRHAVPVELIVHGVPEAETDSQLIALQSVAREALTNIAKHARASQVVVAIRTSEAGIELTVTDDGRGFDPGADGAASRLGLSGMRTRIGLLGGELRVESRPGGPTSVTAVLRPWRPEAS